MINEFDYSQKVFVAIEINQTPISLSNAPKTHAIFKRLNIKEIYDVFNASQNFLVKLLAGKKFNSVLQQRMGYWEKRLNPGHQCFVHFAIGSQQEISNFFADFKNANYQSFIFAGIFHVLPQASACPQAFPFGTAPNQWFLGEERNFTENSVFWFNYFPQQKYLFEKTYQAWLFFNILKVRSGGECNQLVYADAANELFLKNVDPFIEINLNRFTSIEGFLSSAKEAGKQSFTPDTSFEWYGMLLKAYK